MGSTWVPSGADRTQVGPMLAPWTLLSGVPSRDATKISIKMVLPVGGCYILNCFIHNVSKSFGDRKCFHDIYLVTSPYSMEVQCHKIDVWCKDNVSCTILSLRITCDRYISKIVPVLFSQYITISIISIFSTGVWHGHMRPFVMDVVVVVVVSFISIRTQQ